MDLISSKYMDTILDDLKMSDINFDIKCDIYEENNKYVIELELPGFNKDHLNVVVNDEYLTIKATNNIEDVNLSNRNYLRQERIYGDFERTFYLSKLDKDDIDASFIDGVLKIEAGKLDKSNRIEIR